MDLPLNNVLNLTKEEIENSKIEFNMQAGQWCYVPSLTKSI